MEELIFEALNNVGVYITEYDKGTRITDIIDDSLTYVSFFVELETILGKELPFDFFVDINKDLTILDLAEKLISAK